MSALTALICVGAALCISLKSAVWLTGVVALTGLAVWGLRLLPSRGVALPPCAGGVLGVGVGGALWLLTQGFFPETGEVIPSTVWLYAVFFLCGIAVVTATECASFLLCRIAVAWWLTGAVREWLTSGSLFGQSFSFDGVSAEFEWGVGGLLVAAVITWLFRIHTPFAPAFRRWSAHTTFAVAGITVVVGVLQIVWQPLSELWRFWLNTAATVVAVGVVSRCFPRPDDQMLAVIPPLLISLIPTVPFLQTLWWVVGAGVVAGLGLLIFAAMSSRLRRVPASFSGAPAVLTVAAVLLAAVSPL